MEQTHKKKKKEEEKLGVLVLSCHVSIETRRGHSVLVDRPGNSVVPVDDQNLLFQQYLRDTSAVYGR